MGDATLSPHMQGVNLINFKNFKRKKSAMIMLQLSRLLKSYVYF